MYTLFFKKLFDFKGEIFSVEKFKISKENYFEILIVCKEDELELAGTKLEFENMTSFAYEPFFVSNDICFCIKICLQNNKINSLHYFANKRAENISAKFVNHFNEYSTEKKALRQIILPPVALYYDVTVDVKNVSLVELLKHNVDYYVVANDTYEIYRNFDIYEDFENYNDFEIFSSKESEKIKNLYLIKHAFYLDSEIDVCKQNISMHLKIFNIV